MINYYCLFLSIRILLVLFMLCYVIILVTTPKCNTLQYLASCHFVVEAFRYDIELLQVRC